MISLDYLFWVFLGVLALGWVAATAWALRQTQEAAA
jgi:hypothetical protein